MRNGNANESAERDRPDCHGRKLNSRSGTDVGREVRQRMAFDVPARCSSVALCDRRVVLAPECLASSDTQRKHVTSPRHRVKYLSGIVSAGS